MEQSASLANLAKALVKFHGEVGKINKGSENPFFKSKYASLPDILSAISDPLQSSGLAIIQLPDGDGLTTILIHAESGEYVSATAIMKPVKNDPQSMGSAITYQRRYSIGSVLSLNIDIDDDGNAGTQPPKTTPPATQPPKAKEQAIKKPVLTPEAFGVVCKHMKGAFPCEVGKEKFETKNMLHSFLSTNYTLTTEQGKELTELLTQK